MSFHSEIADQSSASVGQTVKIVCPNCLGGTFQERSMSVTREAFRISYCCHRASCGYKGYVPAGASPQTTGQMSSPHSGPYEGPITRLSNDAAEALARRYGMAVETVQRNIKQTADWYALPLWTADGECRGYGVRWPWGAANKPDGTSKYKLFMTESYDVPLSWYRTRNPRPTVLLVEDQLSAMRASERLDIDACAIIGTHLSVKQIAEIQRVHSHVVLALDADATEKAFKLAREWGPAFRQFRVLVLEQDIKDMALFEIDELEAGL